jgi:hypothetical protein
VPGVVKYTGPEDGVSVISWPTGRARSTWRPAPANRIARWSAGKFVACAAPANNRSFRSRRSSVQEPRFDLLTE